METPQLDLNWILHNMTFLFLCLFNFLTWQMHSREKLHFPLMPQNLKREGTRILRQSWTPTHGAQPSNVAEEWKNYIRGQHTQQNVGYWWLYEQGKMENTHHLPMISCPCLTRRIKGTRTGPRLEMSQLRFLFHYYSVEKIKTRKKYIDRVWGFVTAF